MPRTEDDMPSATPRHPDPHGQAALLLVESLVHQLMERGVLTHANAIDTLTTAVEVQADLDGIADDGPPHGSQAQMLLSSILHSLTMAIID